MKVELGVAEIKALRERGGCGSTNPALGEVDFIVAKITSDGHKDEGAVLKVPLKSEFELADEV